MGFDETDYVYKITVDGTDIVEYYDLEEQLPAKDVAELWLSDAKENHGKYIEVVFRGKVNVELLTETDEEGDHRELEEAPIPLPSKEDYQELI